MLIVSDGKHTLTIAIANKFGFSSCCRLVKSTYIFLMKPKKTSFIAPIKQANCC